MAEDLHRDVRTFQVKLIRLRRKKGLSQRALARLAEVSFSTISRMESGHDFTFSGGAKVADALGYPLAEFLMVEPCDACHGSPPKGFTCNTCGASEGDDRA